MCLYTKETKVQIGRVTEEDVVGVKSQPPRRDFEAGESEAATLPFFVCKPKPDPSPPLICVPIYSFARVSIDHFVARLLCCRHFLRAELRKSVELVTRFQLRAHGHHHHLLQPLSEYLNETQ